MSVPIKCADTSYLFDDLCKALMQSQGYVARFAKLNPQDADLSKAADHLERAIGHISGSLQGDTDGIKKWVIA